MVEEEEGPLSMTASSSSASNLTMNPFETASLDSMHLPAFSPSVFKPSQRSASSKKVGLLLPEPFKRTIIITHLRSFTVRISEKKNFSFIYNILAILKGEASPSIYADWVNGG